MGRSGGFTGGFTGVFTGVFTSEYYDEEYFAGTKGGKRYFKPNGTCATWSYYNQTGEFLGAREIAEAWKTMFNPKTALDVGCGRGTFVAYMRDVGIEAYGFDFSRWAIDHPYSRCKPEWLLVHDATEPWPYPAKSFDLVVALDFYEHVYEEDLDFVAGEMFRVASQWIFLQIAVAGSGGLQGRSDKGYVLKKGEPVPVELEGCAVAGHVTVQPEEWWYERLDTAGGEEWLPRRDMVQWFKSLVRPEVISNWLQNSIVVLQRV